MVAFIGNTLRGKVSGENFDESIASHQNLSDFPPSKSCAIRYTAPTESELPACSNPNLTCVMQKYHNLFCTKPGYAENAWHYIPTVGNSIKVPPRRIPAHYPTEVSRQIQTMLEEGIIRRSKSPWVVPTVFVPKKSGQLRICIDYREFNKRTTKDSYPLPLPDHDEVQDQLVESTMFSTLDLHSGYWQLPINPSDQEKTAFCPGPAWGFMNFAECPLGCLVPLAHSSV